MLKKLFAIGIMFCSLQAMAQYTASVAIHSELRLVALTAPRANRLFVWDLDSGAVRLDAPMPDCAGVGAVKDGFVVTDEGTRRDQPSVSP